MLYVEIVAVILSASAVCLGIQQHIWCWPIGLLSALLYSYIFFHEKIYSDFLLQLIFAFMQLYGWWKWDNFMSRQQGRRKPLRPLHLSKSGCLVGLLIGAFGGLVLGYIMANFTDAQIPWLDSVLTSFSLVAQFWVSRRYIANWCLWIAVDTVYIGVYVYKDMTLTAGLYASFLALAVTGLMNWRLQALSSSS